MQIPYPIIDDKLPTALQILLLPIYQISNKPISNYYITDSSYFVQVKSLIYNPYNLC